MKINNIDIDLSHKPLVIAELSGNHNQSIDRAFEIIDASAKAKVDIVKLQTYTPDTITLDLDSDEFYINDINSLWSGRSLYSLYAEAHTPWEWQSEILSYAKQKGLLCFSSVFDESSVDFLEGLDVPAYKIASQEIIHIPLLKKVAKTGKPIIISTGMATLAEIENAVNTVRTFGNSEIALLKCTSSYPANPDDSNILTIPYLRKLFNCEVGLSDHTLGIGAAIAAVSHGATLIEKHVTLKRSDGGVDSAFSLEPEEIGQLVVEVERAWRSLGKPFFGPTNSELSSMTGRRSIYISKDVLQGDILTEDNVRIIRPNLGLSPQYYDVILGRKAKVKLRKGTPLEWSLIE